MFAKASTIFAVLAVAAQVVVATPPACVIAAVNTQDDPSDFKAVCGAIEVQQYLRGNCGNELDAAHSYFSEYCKAHNADVAAAPSTHSATKSSSGSPHSATPTGSGSGSDRGTHSDSGSATGTAAGAYPVGTGGASGLTPSANANGSYTAPTASGTTPASPTESGAATSTGGAARLGLDVGAAAALGVLGALLAL